MTPNNLVNMAYIKGLSCIAVTDHNTGENLPAIQAVAEARGITLLPGIEAETREGVHVLCYFDNVHTAVDFGRMLHEKLPPIPNQVALFGEQLIMNEEDETVGQEDRLLIQSLELSLDELCACVEDAGGLCVPAHINRGSSGLLTALGFLPDEPKFAALEISRNAPAPLGDLGTYKILYASDAHYLEDISEPEFFLDLEQNSTPALFAYLQECRARRG